MRYLMVTALALVLTLAFLVGCAPKEEKPLEPSMSIDECKTNLAGSMDNFNDQMKAITADETLTPEEGFPKLLELVKTEKADVEGLAEEFKAVENIPEEAQADYDELNTKVGDLIGAFATMEEAYSADFTTMKPEDMAAWEGKVSEAMATYETVAKYCGAKVPSEEEVTKEEGAVEEETGEKAPAKETPAEEGGK
jgi:hypothetical protein